MCHVSFAPIFNVCFLPMYIFLFSVFHPLTFSGCFLPRAVNCYIRSLCLSSKSSSPRLLCLPLFFLHFSSFALFLPLFFSFRPILFFFSCSVFIFSHCFSNDRSLLPVFLWVPLSAHACVPDVPKLSLNVEVHKEKGRDEVREYHIRSFCTLVQPANKICLKQHKQTYNKRLYSCS